MTYWELINNILETRGRFGITNGEYKERHHIIPRCVGGTDDEENLIDLYAREHFIAHKLLIDIYPDNDSIKYAYWRMRCNGNIELSPEEYEEARLLLLDVWKRPKSEETKQKMRKPKSELHRLHIIEALSRRIVTWEPWNKGKHAKDDPRIKLSYDTMFKKGQDPWNKGLTKDTDERVKSYGEKGSKTRAGKSWSEKRRVSGNKKLQKKVLCIETGVVFNSIAEAGEIIGICKNNISNVCCGKRQTAGGYHWKFYKV